MQRRIRKYRRKLRKKFLVLSKRILNLFYKTSKPIISHGNKAQLIKSGPEAFELFLKFINESKEYIFLEYYIFRNDRHGQRISEALIKKVKEGVKVFLIYDYIGCIDTDSIFFENLKKNGIFVVAFNPIKFISNPLNWEKRNHRKLAIFDGLKAFVSGWNIGSEYFETHQEAMRDAGVLLEGPCIKRLENIFKSTFEKQSGIKISINRKSYEPAGNDEVWIIESGPKHKFRTIYNAYRLAIISARRHILIENAYFVPTLRLRRALINAVKKGVDVRIVLPDKIDVPLVKYASYNHYKTLLLGGIKIYERSAMILHSKIASIDNVWTTIGSANLHKRSLEKNYELNIVVISEKFGNIIQDFIFEDINKSKEIVYSEWKNRPFKEKVKEKIAYLFSFFL